MLNTIDKILCILTINFTVTPEHAEAIVVRHALIIRRKFWCCLQSGNGGGVLSNVEW